MNKYHIETIKVNHKDGHMIINKCDFDPTIHKEYKKDKPKLDNKPKD